MGLRRINLLPPEERQKASRERGLMYALAVLVLVVAVLGVLYVMENRAVAHKQDQLAAVQAQVAQVQAQVDQLKPFEQMQSQRAQMVTVSAQIYQSRVIWSSILEELSLVIPENVSLTGLNAAVPSAMLAGGTGGGATTPASTPGVPAAPDITLTGVTRAQTDVAEFMTRLGLLPQLMNVQLVSTDKSTSAGDGGDEVVNFQITAQLRPLQTAAPPLSGVPAAGSTAAATQGTGE